VVERGCQTDEQRFPLTGQGTAPSTSPLVITKGGTSIVPHQNWRGQFARGTYADGVKLGQRSDCTSFPASGCIPIQWPGERTTARHELEADGNIQNWFGGLVDGMRDASGQMYMRNRYYDPQSGQFTQADPIGLAGGLNAYGFAAGDPVSYDDPYGLCPIRWLCNIAAAAADNARESARDFRNRWVEDGGPNGMMREGMRGGNPVLIAAAGTMGGPQPRFLSGVSLNRAVGLRAEAAVARQLMREGNTILGSQVTVRTSAGSRVVDHIIRTEGGDILAIEVKTGGAARSASQLAKDHAIAVEGGIPVGKTLQMRFVASTFECRRRNGGSLESKG
jgi:RHS repeat-associated protein